MEPSILLPAKWAEQEFGGAALGDSRRGQRLIMVASALAEHPSGTLATAIPDASDLMGAYRLFWNEEITHEKIIEPHCRRTHEACRAPGHYLLIEDSVSLNFASRHEVEGMGWMGDGDPGLTVHNNLAVRIEEWDEEGKPGITIVGLVGQEWWTRTEPPKRGKEKKAERLSRRRESERWGRQAMRLGKCTPGVRWSLVCDREGDIYEVFGRCGRIGADFLIRSKEPRAVLGEKGSIHEHVAAAPLLGTMTVDLRARPGMHARTAVLELRSVKSTLRPPWRPKVRLQPQEVSVIEAKEVGAPEGCEPIHWILLTDWKCENFEDARRAVRTYSRRWIIEEFHKGMKTGAGVEKIQLGTLRQITAYMGLLSVLATRLVAMRLLATTRPDDPVPAEHLESEVFEILEAKFGAPKGSWTNLRFLIAVARLGGFLARKSDGCPGWITLWRGWMKLLNMVEGVRLLRGP